MTVPDMVDATLDGEEISTRVSLGSGDELIVTPSRTLLYRSDGLLSDESVDEFSHEATQVTVSEGRRKTSFSLTYPIEGERTFKVPASKTEDVLLPVVAGVLSGNEITEPGESVRKVYRFSELTLILTDNRLVKHIGAAVWAEDFEEYHFGTVTDLSFEDGSVATQLVLEVEGRPQRIKAPNEHADELRQRLERALFDYHDIDSIEELHVDDTEDDDPFDPTTTFSEAIDPLDPGGPSIGDDEPPTLGSDEIRATARHTTESTSLETDAVGTRSDGAAIETEAEVANGAAASAGTQRETEDEPIADAAQAATPDSASALETDDVETATATDADLAKRLETVETVVEAQTEHIEAQAQRLEYQTDLLEQQTQLIDQLIEELRAGR